MSDSKTFAFEIGTEEIPAFDLKDATEQLKVLVPKLLDDRGIKHGDVEIYTTPRRQIFIAKDVLSKTEEKVEKFRGPTKKIALDKDGKPTKALLGFAKSKGVEIDDLIVEGEGQSAVYIASVTTPAADVLPLLADVCLNTINGIKWPKTCNWGQTKEVYSRPVRWLFAMFGNDVVEFEYANLKSSNTTIGHRFMSPGPHVVNCADELIEVVSKNYVVPTQELRKNVILEKVKEIEKKTGLVAKIPDKTLVEVTNLCEFPTPMVGQFDEEFLKVPEEIIVDAMLMHQRYFPLYEKNGRLANKFVIISNGNPDNEEVIVEGNERVVAARLYDAKFFYTEDLKKPLEDNVELLNNVIFQEKLGTIKQKNDRNVELATYLSCEANLDESEKVDAVRAAYLAKADLPSQAVIEFTSVQGVMGSYYALASGENERVSLAIKQHYCPRFAGDIVPVDNVGKCVALADKLDTVCGLIAVGEKPTGSKDPLGVRRAALGVVSILNDGFNIELVPAIKRELEILKEQIPSLDKDKAYEEIIDFFISRAVRLSEQAGCSSDTIEAVLCANVCEPTTIISRAKSLQKARIDNKETFDNLSSAFVRAVTLSDPSLGFDIDESLLNSREKDLIEKIKEAKLKANEFVDSDFSAALDSLSSLRLPIDDYFENTMIMDKDEAVRKNRIKLLNTFISAFDGIADFRKFSK